MYVMEISEKLVLKIIRNSVFRVWHFLHTMLYALKIIFSEILTASQYHLAYIKFH